MSRHRTPYPPEFRQQIIDLSRGWASPRGTGEGIRADRTDHLQLGRPGRSRCRHAARRPYDDGAHRTHAAAAREPAAQA
jgi:hypothetical protein